MRTAPRFRGTGLLLGLVGLAGCSVLTPPPAAREPANVAIARRYLESGRAALASGNEPNARFLIGGGEARTTDDVG